MFALPSGLTHRSQWINLLGLVLSLAVSGVLILAFRNGPPSRQVFAALLCSLGVMPLLFRWQFGWTSIFLVMPFYNLARRLYLLIDPKSAGGSFDLLTLMPDLLLVLMLTGYLLRLKFMVKGPDFNDRLLRAFIGFMVGDSLVEVFNPWMGSVVAGTNGFRVFTLWMAMYFLTQVAITKREQVFRWIRITLYMGALAGIYGAYQYVYGFPEYDHLWAHLQGFETQTIGDSLRAFSSFSFCSTFAHYMVISGVTCVGAMRMRSIGLFTRLLIPFFIACVLLGLAFTFVRSAYVGLVLAIFIGAIVSGSTKGRYFRILTSVAVAFILLNTIPHGAGDANFLQVESSGNLSQLVTQRAISTLNPTEVGSMGARFNSWERLLYKSFWYPFGYGLGAGNSSRFTGNFVVEAQTYSESQYFGMLAELGWPGFIGFILLTSLGVLRAIQAHDQVQDPDLKRVALICVMIQVGLLGTGIAGGATIEAQPGAAYFWAAMGLATVLPRLEKSREEEPETAA